IGIIGGIILIISPFLAWFSFSVTIPYYGPVSFSASLISIAEIASLFGGIWSYIPIIILILLIVGGIVSFFKGLIGGIIGLVGVLIFTVLVFTSEVSQTLSLLGLSVFNILGIGYYLAWIGAIIGIISIIYKPRAAPPPYAPPPPPPP
ncbi:MAG: hypothetical protein H3Z52_13045, partial [archaeon]|nr:hypothetical protein [archaeon]